MYSKKVCVVCCGLLLTLSSLAGHPGGKYYGNCQRMNTKKYQYVAPDQSYRKRQGWHEAMMAKKMTPVQGATRAPMSFVPSHYQNLPMVDLPSVQGQREASYHAVFVPRWTHVTIPVVLCTMLLLADLVQAQPIQPGSRVSVGMPSSSGTMQTVTIPSVGVLEYRLKYNEFAHFAEKTHIADQLGGQKLTPEGVVIAVETALYDYHEEIKKNMPESMASDIQIAMQERKSDLLEILLRESPDALKQASEILQQQKTEQPASTNSFLESVKAEFGGNLGEPSSDVKSEGMPSELYRLEAAKLFQDEGTKDNQVGSSYAPLLNEAAKLFQAPALKSEFAGTAYEPVLQNAAQYFKTDAQKQVSAGWDAPVYQPFVQNAPQFLQPGIPRNDFGGNAFQPIMQNPAQYFQGNMPRNEFGGNAFGDLAHAGPQFFGGPVNNGPRR